ncbi:MAG: class II glutamine amidotransferase [Deltaproteobacteria bacterium]|nr:class II glutamine amidotransferase [Deltaproteobacteria bacterium]
MTPCFAFLCSDPALLDIAITPFKDALRVADGAPSGWGVAYYQAGQPLLHKQPRAAAAPFDIVDATHDLKTPLFLGQIREAWDLPNRNENTPPFRFRRWTFTLSGTPPHMDAVRDEVNEAIPKFIQRNIRGRTNAEIIFHLLLAFLNDAGKLDDPRTEGAPIARALTSTLSYVDRLVGDAWPYCCAITNGHTLAATHRDHPMHIKKSQPYIHVGVGPDDKPLSYPHLHALAILGSTPPEGDGWERVDGGTVLTTNLDLDINLSTPAS